MSSHCKHCGGQGDSHTHSHQHTHNHTHGDAKGLKGFLHTYLPELISGLLLLALVIMRQCGVGAFETPEEGVNVTTLISFIIALLPVGLPVIREMVGSWRKGSVMNEFTLMVAAAAGAFVIGEYPEAVAVLLFYSFGEKLEDTASDDVRRRIKSLLGRLPDTATVVKDGVRSKVAPSEVPVGSHIIVQPGERVPLDAHLTGEDPVEFDTAAITGESVPRSFNPGQELPSGIIPVDRAIEAVTTRPFNDSSMTRIMKMIKDAQAGKSHTETMLRRITRWYTPVVFILALAIFFIPWAVTAVHGDVFNWSQWLRRSLVFLVCSCPCALVVSIPLSYFVSLGTASRIGLLFKGSRYIDAFRKIRNVVFDKTGTLTTGKFHVNNVDAALGSDNESVVALAAALDANSSHPLAQAITAYASSKGIKLPEVKDVKTVPHGVSGRLNGQEVFAGSPTLMQAHGIATPESNRSGSRICVAADGKLLGSIYLSDMIKPEAIKAIKELHDLGIKVTILSGDREGAVRDAAASVGADGWKAELLPADKQKIVAEMDSTAPTAFVGDGVNDAPAIAASTVGVAMGTMGTGMAMDTADVIISGDNLLLISRAIRLSKRVQRTVVENVSFALGVKALVMILGAFGIATLWAAVFADTGVTLITVIWTLLRLRKV